jgi:hypothetical protein
MLERYHVKIGFKQEHIKKLEDFTNRLNGLSWKYSSHSIDGLSYRAVDVEGLLRHIKGVELSAGAIFEYYAEGSEIIKACYRINYGAVDIILVLNEDKLIVTIYLNSAKDNHETLQKNIYCRP